MNKQKLFSREKQRQDGIEVKIRRAKIQAKAQQPDFKLKYPSEARDANNGQFTELTKRVTKEVKELQEKNRKLKDKIHAKQS